MRGKHPPLPFLMAQVIFKDYGNGLWKMLVMAEHGPAIKSVAQNHNDKKLANNIRRAAEKIEEYGLCNEWDYFVTLTLSKDLRDRENLDSFIGDLNQFIRNLRKKYGVDIRFLFVPELHANKKGWHLHGFISGLPQYALREFNLSEKLPRYLKNKLHRGEKIYDWPEYSKRFGFCDLEIICNKEKAVRYIKKYITKGLQNTADNITVGKHLYIVSRGLNKPVQYTVDHQRAKNAPINIDLAIEESGYTWAYGAATWYRVGECDK